MKGFAGAILMDLSKAFDCLNHELLIAKLEAYGFSRSALKLVYDYLSNRKQRVKINGSFSKRVMMNAFIVSQFSYCPLVWMFHDRSVNKKINKIHERSLRIA